MPECVQYCKTLENEISEEDLYINKFENFHACTFLNFLLYTNLNFYTNLYCTVGLS